MDPSWQPVLSAAQRRKQRRLRSWWRHEQQSIAAALATFAHHSAPRGQKTARAGGGPRVEVHGGVPGDAPPQAAGAVYYEMDTGEDDGSAPAAERPAPLLEVLPQAGLRRHTGEAFELVLDPVVPQLGRDLTVLPDPMVSRFRRCFEAMDEVERVHGPEAARRLQDALRQGALERETGEHEQEEGEARSSNKMGKKGKRRRRRKKKLPKGSSSSLLHDLRRGRRGVANECVEVVGYSGGVETAPYGSDDGLQRDLNLREERCGSKLDSLESFSCSWATGYATRCSSYDTCYASVLTRHSDTVREANASVVRWRKSWLAAARMECMAKAIKAVKDVTWLLFDDSLDLGLQLGRINAVFGYIHRMIKTGQLSIDDDDEELGDDDDFKFKTRCPRMKSCMTGRMLNSVNSAEVWALHEVYFDAVRGQPRPAGSATRWPSSWTWSLGGIGVGAQALAQ